MTLENQPDLISENNMQNALQTKSIGTKLVALTIGNFGFFVPLPRMIEVQRMQPISRVPMAAEPCVGLMSYQYNPIPVFDLKQWVGGSEVQEKGKLLAILNIKKEEFALIIDAIGEVQVGMADRPEKLPEGLDKKLMNVLDGQLLIDGSAYLLLNCEKLLTL